MIRRQDERSDELRSMLEFLTWVGGGAIHWEWKHRNNAGCSGRDDRFTLDMSAKMFSGQMNGGTDHPRGDVQAGDADQDTRLVISNGWPLIHDPYPTLSDVGRNGSPEESRESGFLGIFASVSHRAVISGPFTAVAHKCSHRIGRRGKFIIPGVLGAQLFGSVVAESLAGLSKAALLMPLCLNLWPWTRSIVAVQTDVTL